MLTAGQIAKKTKLELYTVRYRLSELRRNGRVEAEQFGTTYVYPDSVVKQVKEYTPEAE